MKQVLERVVGLLGRSRRTVELDRPPHLSSVDLATYVERRLLGGRGVDDPESEVQTPTPYVAAPALARRVATAVARRAAGNYLVAQLVSRYLAEADEVIDTREAGWSDQFPETVETALDEYLARIDDTVVGRRRIHDLLMPLAFALGEGLSGVELWAAIAASLSGAPCRPDDITTLLDTAAGFLVDRSPQGTYRLYHSAMERYLQSSCRHPTPHEAIVAAILGSLPPPGPDRWAAADPYATAHVAEHAKAAGDEPLARLLSDDDLVLHADPAGILRSLSTPSRTVRDVALVYSRVAHHFTADIGGRAAYLRLSARQVDVTGRFAALMRPDMPWTVGAVMWESQPDHEVLFALDAYPTAARLSCGPDPGSGRGPVRVLTSRSKGELALIHIADGIVLDSERSVCHDDAITALDICETDDSRLLVVTGDRGGNLFLSAVDDALLLALSRHPHRLHDGEVTAISVVAAGGDAVYCLSGDARGQVVLSRIGPQDAERLGSSGLDTRITSAAIAVDGRLLCAVVGTLGGDLALVRQHRAGETLLTSSRISTFGVPALNFAASVRPLRLWAGTSDGLLKGFAVAPDLLIPTHEATGIEAAFTTLTARADMILTGSADGHVARTPLPDRNTTPGARARLHEGRVVAVASAEDAPAPSIVSLGEDRRVVRWDADPDAVPGGSRPVTVTRVALAAATAPSADGSILSVAMDDEARTVIWRTHDGTLDLDRAVGQSSPGQPVGTVSSDGTQRGAVQVGLAPAVEPASGRRRPVRGSHQAVAAVRSGDGLDVLTVSTMGAVRLHRIRDTAPEPRTIAGTDGQQLVTAIAAAPIGGSGLVVATGSAEGDVEAWTFDGAEFAPCCPPTPVGDMDSRLGFVRGLADDASWQLVVADARGRVQLVTPAKGGVTALVPPWQVSDAPVTAVSARAADGQTWLATGTQDGRISFWSVTPAGIVTWLTSLRLGSRVLCIGLGDRADAVVWCRQGVVTLTNIRGLPST
jgi:hypothetical protein